MAEIREIPKDTILFYEGEIPDNMYVIKTGGFDILKKIDGTEVKISEAVEGQLIGEMALFDLKPRSATIKANQNSTLVVLPYVNLLDQLEKLPAWVKIVMRSLSDNLRKTNEQITKK